jgi:hypothetical protein
MVFGYLLFFSAFGYLPLRQITLSESTVVPYTLLPLLGLVVRCGGFVVVAVALFGRGSHRDRRLRRAAWAIAAGYAISLAAATWSIFINFYAPEPRPPGYTTGAAVYIAYYLFATAAVLVVASAFARTMAGSRRNRRLGWGAAAMVVGGALVLVEELLGGVWLGVREPAALGETAQFARAHLFVLAGATAAIGFFASARTGPVFVARRLAKRDGYLSLAALWLLLSYAADSVKESGTLWMSPYSVDELLDGDPRVMYFLLLALGSALFAIGSLVVAAGFGLSRRGLLKQDRESVLLPNSAQE